MGYTVDKSVTSNTIIARAYSQDTSFLILERNK